MREKDNPPIDIIPNYPVVRPPIHAHEEYQLTDYLNYVIHFIKYENLNIQPRLEVIFLRQIIKKKNMENKSTNMVVRQTFIDLLLLINDIDIYKLSLETFPTTPQHPYWGDHLEFLKKMLKEMVSKENLPHEVIVLFTDKLFSLLNLDYSPDQFNISDTYYIDMMNDIISYVKKVN